MKLDPRYLAGLFDGEGHVSIVVHTYVRTGHLKPSRPDLHVGIANNCVEVLELVKEDWQGSIGTYQAYEFGKKPVSRWTATNRKAGRFLLAIEPFVVIKRRPVEIGIEFQSLVMDVKGRTTIPPEILARRHDLLIELRAINGRKEVVPDGNELRAGERSSPQTYAGR